jgi:4-alpha-glucanotransferase
MDRMLERAAVCGIELRYHDGLGHLRTVEPPVLARLLDAIAPDGDGDAARRLLPRTIVRRGGVGRELRLELPDGEPLRWAEGTAVAPLLTLPCDLPTGMFRLRVTCAGRSDEAGLIVVPERAYQGDEVGPKRMWSLAVQLYSVRSARNWGHGDFTDLAALIDLAADLGASAVGLNPLHALFDDRPSEPSPYFPNSRLFLDPLYIDLDAVPEFPGLRATGLEDEVVPLRATDMVDRATVTDLKMRALRLAYANFGTDVASERRAAFEQFRRTRSGTLARFACFERLRRRFATPWWQWPEPFRRLDDAAVDALRRGEAAEIGFIEFVQWLAHEQLERCVAHARARNLPIGLYLDIAVGVRRDGFDTWCDQDAIIPGMAIGAPPDMLNRAGQDWGLAAFNPVALEQQNFGPFRRILEASMQYAGAIRLDHVLGLQRLFLVPDGMTAEHGAYIRCPFEALLGVTAVASATSKCIVVGEDLGTVPENFRSTLADWGLWSYQVMLFERRADGGFAPPQAYRENALVTFATHDLPTYAGWRAEHDLAVKHALGLDPGESSDERRAAFAALDRALNERGLAAPSFASVAHYLAGAPTRLLVVSLEDLLGVVEQVNLPGTVDQHPNWRRRLPVTLEELPRHDGVRAVSEAMRAAGRNCGTASS